jgi:hypothetical protein
MVSHLELKRLIKVFFSVDRLVIDLLVRLFNRLQARKA